MSGADHLAEAQAPTPSSDRLALDAEGLNAFLLQAFPHADPDVRGRVVEAQPGRVRVRILTGDLTLRPGGLVSGPTQMALADVAGYALTLGHVGPVAMAVTSSLSLHFLRGCPPGRLHAEANLLRLGRRLVTSEVRLFVEDPARLVAQGTVVYALPATDAGAAA